MTTTPPRSVAELAHWAPACTDRHAPADDVSALHALGAAATVRPASRSRVLGHVRRRGHRGCRRAPARHGYLTAALLRCALYLGPLSVAVAAARPLSRVPWLVPVVVLLLGWSAAQALAGVGMTVARRSGAAAGARLVGGGFLAAGALCGALIWVAPAGLLGGERLLAALIGAGGLATLATVTAALVTRAEAAVIRWSLPCWLLAAVTLAGGVGDGWADRAPTEPLLLAAIAIGLIRAFRPAFTRGCAAPDAWSSGRRGEPGPWGDRPPLARSEVRRGFGLLIVGAAQASCVALLWRAGPAGVTSPGALPLLAAVPVLEALVAWHIRQVDAGLDLSESDADYARHVRGVAIVTVAGLLPPLTSGAAARTAARAVRPRAASRKVAAKTPPSSVPAASARTPSRASAMVDSPYGNRYAATASAAPLVSGGSRPATVTMATPRTCRA